MYPAASAPDPSTAPVDDAEAVRLAAEQAEQDRMEDIASIKRAFRKGGLKGAVAVGKALGWTRDAVEGVFTTPSEPLPSPATAGDPAPTGDGEAGGDRPPRRPRPIVKPLPEDCPVIPLGTMGGLCHYLDPHGQHMQLAKHGPEDIRSLFSTRVDWLYGFWPKFKKNTADPEAPPILYSWETAYTAESLIAACGQRGLFDPGRRLRGVGAWAGDEGELILHCGDGVLFVPASEGQARWERPGYHGEHVYPGSERVPRPSDGTAPIGIGGELLRLLSTWNYDEPDEDHGGSATIHGRPVQAGPLLLFGWIMSALMGGALEWRTHVCVTGGEGTGKSTLQRLVGRLMGEYLVQATDATAAGVYQSVGYSSRPAAIDEAENDPNSLKMKNMVELVRNSASGGGILRGSNDARFKAFQSRTSFFLSAIFLPSFSAQDLTRVAVIELKPLPIGATPPPLDMAKIGALGRGLRRRIVDHWQRWPATFAAYSRALAEIGHERRGCDQWGTLLAAADLALFDAEPDPDTVRALVDLVGRPRLKSASGDATTAQTMVDTLRTMPVDAFRGGNRLTLGALVAGACGRPGVITEMPEHAENALKTYGIYLRGTPMKPNEWRVFLPNSHTGLAQLLERTAYGTRPGAASSGWAQAMRRLPGAEAHNGRPHGRGWSVPLSVFLGEDRMGDEA